MAVNSIAGEWHGRYYYDASSRLSGDFTAFFSENSGSLQGTIVDESRAGKASLSGSFSFPSVQFTKVYLKPSENKRVEKRQTLVPKVGLFGRDQIITTTITTTETFGTPVEYEGLMTEDGKTLNGKWKLTSEKGVMTGTWTANKLIEDEEHKDVKEKVKRVKEHELDEVV